MASDKDPIMMDSKASNMFPSLTSNNSTNKPVQQANELGAGFYQSQVVQKGKLILPTALWILLIVAGLCFLSLLATLNKTVHTLDTLVELEQEHAKRAGNSPLFDSSPEAAKLQLAPDSEPTPEAGSWFSMPAWTALEPNANQKRAKSDQEPFGGLLSDLLSKLGESAPTGNNAGGIIIASAGLDDQSSGMDDSNPLKALMGQLVGKSGGEQQPLISANIDKINININTNTEEREPKSARRKDNVHSLDQSIDRLVEDLVGGAPPRLAMPAPEPTSVFDNLLVGPPLPTPHRHHHHRRPEGHAHRFQSLPEPPFSPISSLLLGPLELGPLPARGHPRPEGEMLIPSPVSKSIDEFLAPPAMFGRPQHVSESFLILGGDTPAKASAMSTPPFAPELLVKHHQKISEPLNSPYEMLPFGIPMMFGRPEASALAAKRHRAKQHKATEEQMNALDEDFISSLAQSLFPGQESSGKSELKEAKKEPAPGGESLLLLAGGEPGRKANNDEDKRQQKEANQVKDLFQMFFGPPPKSKLTVASSEPSSSEIPKPPIFSLIETEIKPFSSRKEEQQGKKPETKEDKLASGPVIFTSGSGPEELKEDKQILDSLLGSFFSSAQFGKDEQPLKVEAQSSGNRDTKSSTTSASDTSKGPFSVEPTALEQTSSSEATTKQSDFSTTTLKNRHDDDEEAAAAVEKATSTTVAPQLELLDLNKIFTNIPKVPSIELGTISTSTVAAGPLQPTTPLPSTQPEVSTPKVVVSFTLGTQPEGEFTTSSTNGPMVTQVAELAPAASNSTSSPTSTPFKAFLQKADDFIEKNIVNLRNLLARSNQ